MNDRERLEKLLQDAFQNNGPRRFGEGNRPIHYKRISLSEYEREKYALLGAQEMFSGYREPIKLFETQAIIAGVCLSGDFDKIGIVTPSQYGKSWLMGHISLLLAYGGMKVNVAAANSDGTDIIMQYCMRAVSEAEDEIKRAVTAETLKKVDRLDQSMSKQRVSIPGRGSIEGVSLGDTFEDVSKRNKAVGRSGAYLTDETANISAQSMAELGRREFSSITGKKDPLIMISNPHKPGYFYDFITKDPLGPRECVIWMDALTAAQEGRWSVEHILTSDFMDHADTIQRYLLCELPSQGAGMFDDDPIIRDESEKNSVRVMGIDAAYKGKDNIEIGLCEIEGDKGIHFSAIETVKKGEWIDGVTSVDICDQVAKLYHRLGCAYCCVDIGFGVWLLEGLRQRGVDAYGVNFGAGATKYRIRDTRAYSAINAVNKRAEMHLDLKDVMEHHACTFTQEVYDSIKDVFPLVTSERKPNGKLQVVSKQEIKSKIGHSPDKFDALLLSLHAAVRYCDGAVAYMTE